MNKHIFPILAATLLLASPAKAEYEINLFDEVTYYDGYLVERIPEDAPDEGCLRLYTYLNTVKMTDQQLDAIGQHLGMEVTIHAACDNYDRIGSVNLAFIPKGQDSYQVKYNDSDPMRIEIARFITPFMNKNKEPKAVSYYYTLDNLTLVLRSAELRQAYDIWVELEVFGVPYAAQQQVSGCAGCIDVFRGSLALITDDQPEPLSQTCVFVPVVTRRSDWRADRGMNNYNEACTDELGKTVKTWEFDLPTDVTAGRVVIIMSNHGAGTNGEEYSRRMHYASFDGDEVLSWKPGRQTCEPYRKFNTQSNGIYGRLAMSDERWQSFSNWCPGASIPFQTFETGPLSAGKHSVKIEVPAARFYGSDGFFPVSIYFLGDTRADAIEAPADFSSVGAVLSDDDYTTQICQTPDTITATAPQGILAMELYSPDGTLVATTSTPASVGVDAAVTTATLTIADLPSGIYLLAIRTPKGIESRKLCL